MMFIRAAVVATQKKKKRSEWSRLIGPDLLVWFDTYGRVFYLVDIEDIQYLYMMILNAVWIYNDI